MIEKPKTFAYLATPYSKFELGMDDAFVIACRVTAEFIRRGVPCFSPIAHSHPVALHGNMDPLDHGIWLPADAPMMEAASDLHVIHMPGWRESKGVMIEIDVFARAGKPIHHFNYPTLDMASDF